MPVTSVTGRQVKDGDLTDADIATANKDGAAGTASMRTLGTGATQAAAGNHNHSGGVISGLSEFSLPFSQSPTVDANGEIALDTNVSHFFGGVIRYFSATEMFIVAMPVQWLNSPVEGRAVVYNAANDEFELRAIGDGKRIISAVFDGGTSPPAVGTTCYVRCPFAGTLTGWRINGDKASDLSAGSCVVDVWKIASGSAYPTVADTIAASAKPTLTSQLLASNDTLTGWTTAIAAGDIIGFNVDSATTLTRISVELIYNPS